jgi:type II secretory pathway predicted ATPase ExeA
MTALEFYDLKEQPFGVTPDARYLFLTRIQSDALSSLIYGIESGCGLVALIAKPELGKTALLHQTQNILRERARLVFLFQTISDPLDPLRALLSGLGVRDLRGNLVELRIRLKDLLAQQYRAGRRVVLVIDEAQNLEEPVLDLACMLSNFETSSDKLIQIILAGQPQLGDNLGPPELLQLRRRFSIFARLQPLSAEETAQYVMHRLRVAGHGGDRSLFTKDALALITRAVPRNINNLCFNALSLGCALKQMPIDRDILRQVVAILDPVRVRQEFLSSTTAAGATQGHYRQGYSCSSSAGEGCGHGAGWFPKAGYASVALLVVVVAMFVGGEWLVKAELPARPWWWLRPQPRLSLSRDLP